MLAVEPRGDDGGDEELGTVGVGAGVGHGEEEGSVVLKLKVLVGELVAIDGLASGAVAAGEIATLEHEVGDHAMESGALVAEALLASAQRAEVFGSLGNYIVEKVKVDATRLFFDLADLCDLSSVVNLDDGALPGAIEVSFDGHVVCRRSEEAFMDRGAELRSYTESR